MRSIGQREGDATSLRKSRNNVRSFFPALDFCWSHIVWSKQPNWKRRWKEGYVNRMGNGVIETQGICLFPSMMLLQSVVLWMLVRGRSLWTVLHTSSSHSTQYSSVLSKEGAFHSAELKRWEDDNVISAQDVHLHFYNLKVKCLLTICAKGSNRTQITAANQIFLSSV